jgi:hypothetical protein
MLLLPLACRPDLAEAPYDSLPNLSAHLGGFKPA